MAYITLNKKSFFHNLDIITQKACDITKVALVLKDNAYGHGLLEIASMSKEYGIKKAIVKNEAEAEMIESYFDEILILSQLPSKKSSYIYTINHISDIENMIDGCRVALKVDSGMHRNGIVFDELESAFQKMQEKNLSLHSVMTHHRAADTLSSEWFWQEQNFENIKSKSKILSEKYEFEGVLYHSQNSAGLFRAKRCHDLVRVGVAAYGCLDMEKTFEKVALQPILSLYANRISTRVLKKGERAGYNGSEVAHKDMVISNYDLGYGDGFSRSLSLNYITPEGKKVFGRVSMDSTLFSQCDDAVLLIFDDARIVAKQAKTISYEVLVTLPATMKREII